MLWFTSGFSPGCHDLWGIVFSLSLHLLVSLLSGGTAVFVVLTFLVECFYLNFLSDTYSRWHKQIGCVDSLCLFATAVWTLFRLDDVSPGFVLKNIRKQKHFAGKETFNQHPALANF